MDKFEIIYADPPWDYKQQRQHAGPGRGDTGGAKTHYPTVTLDRLKKLDVPALCADDCLLFMWATGPHLDQAIELLKAWAFAWVTVAFVWHKERSPGYYTMSSCEFVLVGKRGKIPQPRGARNVAQFLSKLRGSHSQKPEQIREKIEAMFPAQRKLELFAREQSAGWSVFGNEVPDSISIDWPE